MLPVSTNPTATWRARLLSFVLLCLILSTISACGGQSQTVGDQASNSTSSSSSSGSSQNSPSLGNQLEKGKQLYQAQCMNCHGADGLKRGDLPLSDVGLNQEELNENKLYSEILLTMPKANPKSCDESCSEQITSYITKVLFPESYGEKSFEVGYRKTQLLAKETLVNTLTQIFEPFNLNVANALSEFPSAQFDETTEFNNNVNAVLDDAQLERLVEASEEIALSVAEQFTSICGQPTQIEELKTIAVNVGGGPYLSKNGIQYAADNGHNYSAVINTNNEIAGTEDDELYQTGRKPLGGAGRKNVIYNILAPNGVYNITVNFADIGGPASGHIIIEQQQKEANFNISGEAGGKFTAVDASYENISIKDNAISVATNAQINGIVAEPISNTPNSSSENPPFACTADAFIDKFASLAFRHPLNAEDQQSLINLSSEGRDFKESIALLAQALIISPKTLYRSEAPATAAQGRELNGLELASRLSFFLWQAPPDETLLKLNAQLTETSILLEQAERMLADDRAAQSIANFYSQLMHLDSINEKPASKLTLKQAKELRSSDILFFDYLLRNTEGTFADLHTDTRAFVSPSVATIYGVAIPANSNRYLGANQITLPSNERAGVLTRAGFINANSADGTTSMTVRGNTIRKNILCQYIPPPSADANVDIDKAAGKFGKEFIAAHNDEPSCATCHIYLDELSLSLESFDSVGRIWHNYPDGSTIETDGYYRSLSAKDQHLQGEVKDAVHLSQMISENPVAANCLASRWMEYALARPLDNDQQSLNQVLQKYQQSGFQLKTLLMAIISSKAFRYQGADDTISIP